MLLDRLGRIHQRLAGMHGLSLVDRDGIPVESISMHPDLDLETVAVELLAQMRTMESSLSELEVGPLDHMTITTPTRVILLSIIAPGYFLLLILARTSSLGRARFELRRARLLLEEELR
jgi:predicted regulator of Ras-like GTPase activity (Roadblock/LC7/MglB family)